MRICSQLPVTGLRFFTVYGPWGRPDMAPFCSRARSSRTSRSRFSITATCGATSPMSTTSSKAWSALSTGPQPESRVDARAAGPGVELCAVSRLQHRQQPAGRADASSSRRSRSIGRRRDPQAAADAAGRRPGDPAPTFPPLQRGRRFLAATPIADGLGRFVDWYREVPRRLIPRATAPACRPGNAALKPVLALVL